MVSPDEENDVWIEDSFAEADECKYFKKFTRVRGEIEIFSVSIGDYVYIREMIGLVTAMWETDNNKEVEIRNCYRPHQTYEGVKPYHGNAQILLSVIISTHPTYSIQGRCKVEPVDSFMKINTFDLDTYYYNEHECCKLNEPFVNTVPMDNELRKQILKPTTHQTRSSSPTLTFLLSKQQHLDEDPQIKSTSIKNNVEVKKPLFLGNEFIDDTPTTASTPLRTEDKAISLAVSLSKRSYQKDLLSHPPSPKANVHKATSTSLKQSFNTSPTTRSSHNTHIPILPNRGIIIEESKNTTTTATHFTDNKTNSKSSQFSANDDLKAHLSKSDVFNHLTDDSHKNATQPRSKSYSPTYKNKGVQNMKTACEMNLTPQPSWIETLENGDRISDIQLEVLPFNNNNNVNNQKQLSTSSSEVKELLKNIRDRTSPLKQKSIPTTYIRSNRQSTQHQPRNTVGEAPLRRVLFNDQPHIIHHSTNPTHIQRKAERQNMLEKLVEATILSSSPREGESPPSYAVDALRSLSTLGESQSELLQSIFPSSTNDNHDDGIFGSDSGSEMENTEQLKNSKPKNHHQSSSSISNNGNNNSVINTKKNTPVKRKLVQANLEFCGDDEEGEVGVGGGVFAFPASSLLRKSAASKPLHKQRKLENGDVDTKRIIHHNNNYNNKAKKKSTKRKYLSVVTMTSESQDDDVDLEDFIVPNNVIEYTSDFSSSSDEHVEGDSTSAVPDTITIVSNYGNDDMNVDDDLSAKKLKGKASPMMKNYSEVISSQMASKMSPPPNNHDGVNPSPEGESEFYTKTFKVKEAFHVYVQYLLGTLVEEKFVDNVKSSKSSLSYFKPAVNKIEQMLFDRKELIVSSSIWDPHFKYMILSYPLFSSYQLSNHSENCEACCRSNHPAVFKVTLKGSPYDFVELWKNSALQDLNDTEELPLKKEFYLGRFCYQRSALFHKLHHYKYTLLYQLSEKLQSFDSSTEVSEILELLESSGWINRKFVTLKSLFKEVEEFKSTFASKAATY